MLAGNFDTESGNANRDAKVVCPPFLCPTLFKLQCTSPAINQHSKPLSDLYPESRTPWLSHAPQPLTPVRSFLQSLMTEPTPSQTAKPKSRSQGSTGQRGQKYNRKRAGLARNNPICEVSNKNTFQNLLETLH